MITMIIQITTTTITSRGARFATAALRIEICKMRKRRSVPLCRSGLAFVQMRLVNMEIDLNSWREKNRSRSTN